MLAFYFDDLSSNTAEAYSFYVKFRFEKNENKQKEAGVGPFKKIISVSVIVKLQAFRKMSLDHFQAKHFPLRLFRQLNMNWLFNFQQIFLFLELRFGTVADVVKGLRTEYFKSGRKCYKTFCLLLFWLLLENIEICSKWATGHTDSFNATQLFVDSNLFRRYLPSYSQ